MGADPEDIFAVSQVSAAHHYCLPSFNPENYLFQLGPVSVSFFFTVKK